MATAAEALRKLTGGQTLTNEERALLNMAPVKSGSNATYVGGTKVTPPSDVTPDVKPEEEILKKAKDEDVKLAEEDTKKSTGLSQDEVTSLVKNYTSDFLSRMSQEEKTAERLSAYNILKMEFDQYGLGSLVTDIRDLLVNDTPTSEFGLRLRGTDAYKERFKANEARIAAGLSALSPAEYVALEDQYQNVMRNYGLPANYYAKDTTGKQVGFEKFIAGDVSASELEDRIITAQDRVLKANPEVLTTLKSYYGDSISNGDILAYALNPEQALKDIQRKVTAAEIGGAALAQGLNKITEGTTEAERAAMRLRSEELAGYGVTKAAAQQGYETVAQAAPRGGELAAIYQQGPYGQTDVEAEVFGLAGSAQAKKKREKLSALEQASFSKSTGASSAALGRERALGQGAF
jgi:hypothetical protein